MKVRFTVTVKVRVATRCRNRTLTSEASSGMRACYRRDCRQNTGVNECGASRRWARVLSGSAADSTSHAPIVCGVDAPENFTTLIALQLNRSTLFTFLAVFGKKKLLIVNLNVNEADKTIAAFSSNWVFCFH